MQFELPEEGDEIVVINTSMGTLKVMLFPEIAPKAVENFVTHAKEGYYNGLKFYKIQKDKCLYTGDPKGMELVERAFLRMRTAVSAV